MEKVISALNAEGFALQSEIDIQKAMKERLGVDLPAYCNLGACNPLLAHQALQAKPEIGLLMHCNVTVRGETAGKVNGGFVVPQTMVPMTSNTGVASVADEAGERPRRAQSALTCAA